ncbi:MAG: EH signature domain-containing protein [Paracoccaceae bacterium]
MSLVDRLSLRPEFKVRPSERKELDIVLAKIERAYGRVRSREEGIDTIVCKVEAACARSQWVGVTVGDISIAIQEMFRSNPRVTSNLRRFLEAELEVTTRPELVGGIVPVYLETWLEGATATLRMRELILARATILPWRWKFLFQACPELLMPRGTAIAVGARMVENARPFKWLKEIGLPDPHGPGLMAAAHSQFLAQSPAPKTRAQLEKILTWLAPGGAQRLDDNRAAEAVDHILGPWVTETCPADYRNECVRQLVVLFGDPRRDRKAFWANVREDRRKVLFRWLARQSMETIFEVVGESERGSSVSHQWDERRRFWTHLYDQGLIDEAWVVLGASAAPIAKRLAKERGDAGFLNFALQAGRTREDTCLLIMRIGEKVIVEGSHNFRVHIFPTSSRRTPELYATTYDLDDILLPRPHPDAYPHLGDWQRQVRGRIR